MSDSADQPTSMGIEQATEYLMSRQSDSEAATEGVDEEREDSEGQDEESPELAEEGETEDENDDDSEDESDDEGSEEESDDEEPESDEESDDEKPVFTIKDEDGQEIPVTRDEAEKGYLRQRDYTKKTQEVARERSEIETMKSEMTQQKSEAARILDQLHMAADKELSEFAGIDWVKLHDEDPYEYEEKARKYDALKKQHEQSKEHRDVLVEQANQEYIEELNKLREQEYNKLLEKAPEFGDEEGNKVREKILTFGKENYGFSDEELQNIFDHRATLVLRDATRYHELKAKLDKGKTKQAKAPKHVKPGAKQSPDKRKSKAIQASRAKLQKSHSMDDALDFLMRSTGAKK